MSGWVQLGMNSCWIQTVCLHLIGSVLMFSNRSLHLVLASCGEPSIMRYLFSFLVFRFRDPRFSSFVVRRFQLLVSVTRLPVSRSQFNYVFLVFQSFVRWLLFLSLPLLDVLTFTSC